MHKSVHIASPWTDIRAQLIRAKARSFYHEHSSAANMQNLVLHWSTDERDGPVGIPLVDLPTSIDRREDSMTVLGSID